MGLHINIHGLLQRLLNALKGKHVHVGPLDIELDKQHEFPYESGPVNEGLRNPDPKK